MVSSTLLLPSLRYLLQSSLLLLFALSTSWLELIYQALVIKDFNEDGLELATLHFCAKKIGLKCKEMVMKLTCQSTLYHTTQFAFNTQTTRLSHPSSHFIIN